LKGIHLQFNDEVENVVSKKDSLYPREEKRIIKKT
jgi:hypothetical protein